MGGFGLILIIEFCVRAAILALKRGKGGHWIATEASVTTAVWNQPLECDVAMIQYQYSVDGNKYVGSHNEPFWTMGDWKGSVRRLPPGTAVHILYNPEDPAESVFVDRWWQKL